jgi:hypothetical protein
VSHSSPSAPELYNGVWGSTRAGANIFRGEISRILTPPARKVVMEATLLTLSGKLTYGGLGSLSQALTSALASDPPTWSTSCEKSSVLALASR